MAPDLDRRRAVFVLGTIDDILTWEKTKEQERDNTIRRAGRVFVRGAIEAVLEVGEAQLV